MALLGPSRGQRSDERSLRPETNCLSDQQVEILTLRTVIVYRDAQAMFAMNRRV